MGAKIELAEEDDLPQARQPGWPRMDWQAVFQTIADQHPDGGVAVKVARFDGRWSARRVAKQVEDGVIVVPGGPAAWELVAVAEKNGKGVVTGSELHARFAGWLED